MDNSNDNDPITVVEFCAGYGGLGLGIKRVLGERMRLIGLCELEGFAQANLISKMEAGHMAQVPIWSNLLAFPYRKFRGLVDFAVAGIPCQPHSLAGKRKGGGDERFLFDDWLRGLEQMQPRYILIENVEGLLSSKMPDGTLCIAWTIERLEAMGYKATAGIFSAREVGAPHQRKRVFIMAHDKSQRVQRRESGGADADAWPSRPGEPQHAWEPPRVVGDAKHNGSSQCGADATGTESSSEQGRLQELEGGSASVGDTSDRSNGQHTSEQQGRYTSGRSSAEGVSMGDTQNTNGKDRELSRDQEGGNALRDRDNILRQGKHQRASGDSDEHQECEAQPPLGGNPDGSTSRMDYAELCVSCDNRTDELRLLGNGVAPATAERAFRTLLTKLNL
jgi:DNA (cytosine-5)-methyltransferase 1